MTERVRKRHGVHIIYSLEGMNKRKGKRKLPVVGKVGPVEFLLSGGGGAGRFGRVRVCGTTAAASKEKKEYRQGNDSGNRGKKGEEMAEWK